MTTEYTRGLHVVGRDTYAYLTPPGTWGLSNCGVVVGEGAALLVDTRFDLPPATIRSCGPARSGTGSPRAT